MKKRNSIKQANNSMIEATAVDFEETDRRRIRALLKKPMNKRMNFLRKKLPNGGSCL